MNTGREQRRGRHRSGGERRPYGIEDQPPAVGGQLHDGVRQRCKVGWERRRRQQGGELRGIGPEGTKFNEWMNSGGIGGGNNVRAQSHNNNGNPGGRGRTSPHTVSTRLTTVDTAAVDRSPEAAKQ